MSQRNLQQDSISKSQQPQVGATKSSKVPPYETTLLQAIRAGLTDIYVRYCPEKLPNIDSMMERFDEVDLYRTACLKYNVPNTVCPLPLELKVRHSASVNIIGSREVGKHSTQW